MLRQLLVPTLTLLSLLGAATSARASYHRVCGGRSTPVLCEIHHQVRATRAAQAYTGTPTSRYGHAAEHSTSLAYRKWVRRTWYLRHRHWGRVMRLPVASIIRWVWPDYEQDMAITVATCESGLRPDAYNPSSATGVFQILGGPWNPWANTRMALAMWRARGWQPWTASIGCWG